MRTDCLILGGGLIGCAVALRLRQRGLSVVVVDRGPPGGEASGAAAGILAPRAEAESTGPFFDLALRSLSLHPGFALELRDLTGLDVAYRSDGTLLLAFDETEEEALATRHTWLRKAGHASEWLPASHVRALEPALAPCRAGVRLPDDHQVDAQLLVRAVITAAAQAGVGFRTADARRLLSDGTRVSGADLDGEIFRALEVVVAGGSWSSLIDGVGLPPRAVQPVRGQMLELETRPPPFRHVVFADGGYAVPRLDGRVLVGSTVERVGWKKEVTSDGLRCLTGRASRICPALGEARVLRSWAGFRPATSDGLPYLGPSPLAGLSLATGHYRNGVLLAPVTADLLSATVTGAPPLVELAPFSPQRQG